MRGPDVRARIVTGMIYQPYALVSIVVAAAVVWSSRQAWDVTREVTWQRAAYCFGVFVVAVASLFTQSYNPFIYYIF